VLRLVFALAIPVFPALAAGLGVIGPAWVRRHVAAITSQAMALSWGCAVLTLLATLRLGRLEVTLLTWHHIPLGGVMVDQLSAVMVVFVTTISAIIHHYARRALQGEPRQVPFFVPLSAVTVAVLGVILANSLVLLCVCWALKGGLLSLLIGYAPERQAARLAARHKMAIDLIGDTAFILALVGAWPLFGTLQISAINTLAPRVLTQQHLGTATIVTLLLLVAVLAKSAQLPFSSWLPASLEAPTPVSALMHAGLVNAGGFLIVRLSPLFHLTPVTSGVAVLMGTLTALYGTSVMLTRSDVKNELAYSTMGQMGFMIVECGLGAYAVAIVHLIAHGLFKATLFLGSGDALGHPRLTATVGSTPHVGGRLRRAWVIQVGGLVLVGICIMALHGTLGSLLVLFAWLTGSSALVLLHDTGRATRVVLSAGIILATGGYVGILQGSERFFAPVVGAPAPASPLSVVLAVTVLGGLTSVTALAQSERRPAWLTKAQDTLYVFALQRGYLAGWPPSLTRRRRAW